MTEERTPENDYTGPHPICWTGSDFEHRCQRPSGRRCIDCGEAAGTLWGPIWCPDCDVIRLGNVSRQMESLLSSPSEGAS